MIEILLVSHSQTLAEGVAELVSQIGSSEVPVSIAAGAPDGGLGTSVAKVEEALRGVKSTEGVVIIPDLGSSVLAVQAALEDQDRERTVLVDTPFVEGAVAAVVTASTGADLDSVVAAAKEARDVPKL